MWKIHLIPTHHVKLIVQSWNNKKSQFAAHTKKVLFDISECVMLGYRYASVWVTHTRMRCYSPCGYSAKTRSYVSYWVWEHKMCQTISCGVSLLLPLDWRALWKCSFRATLGELCVYQTSGWVSCSVCVWVSSSENTSGTGGLLTACYNH